MRSKNAIPSGKSIITHEMPSNSFASFNINKQTSFRETYISASSTNGNNIAYNNLNNLNYSSLTSSLTKPANNESESKDTIPLPLRIARKDIKGIGNKINLSKSRSNRSSSMSNSKSINCSKGSNLVKNKLLTFDENKEVVVRSLNPKDEKDDVEMEIDEDKVSLINRSSVERQVSRHDMDVDMEAAKPQTDQERLDYFHGVLMKNHRESLLQAEKHTFQDPLEVSEYVSEICNHMKNTEFDFIAKPGYMKNQPDINEKMRAILIDWLVEVHLKFKLYPETLYLTVNLIDRYLEKEEVLRQHLQLVGVTSMLIASKYEEIYAPEVRDFVYITDKAYTKEEILDMEYKMLTKMEFNVTAPSSYRFLERFYKVCSEADEKVFNLSRYLIELSLVEYRMLKHHPSMLASAALFLSLKILKKEHARWTDELKEVTRFTEPQIKHWAKDLCILLQNIETWSLKAVKTNI